MRILCCREFQKSLSESVHSLLKQQISLMGMDDIFRVQQSNITGVNGSEFIFAGLKHNVTSIKSIAGIDVAWVEEAETVSKASWDTLVPTIREAGSEIWVTFNPRLSSDDTYKRFVKQKRDDYAIVKLNWNDNPWLTDELRLERDALKASGDIDSYLNVWEGHCRQSIDGAVYANELRAATGENRITRVPYDPSVGVQVFFDLGWADQTSLWFAQKVGFEYRILDFYQSRHQTLAHYLKEIENRPYLIDRHWLPHDARAKSLGTGKSIEELVRAAGKKVQIVPSLSIADGINAARTLFPNCWFDEDRCADGLQALRHYKYDVDASDGSYSRTPLHDENSHAADAFRYLAIGLKEPKQTPQLPTPARPFMSGAAGGKSWMNV